MDKALKQRLVGASVLIILAIIVLPMLLSGRSDTLQQESRQIELPKQPEELSFETRRFPVGLRERPVTGTAAGKETDDGSAGDTLISKQADAGADENPVSGRDTDDPASPLDVSSHGVDKPPAVTSITLNSPGDENPDKPMIDDGLDNTPRYLVQVASFSIEKNANALASRLRADNFSVLMDVVDRAAGRLHRVRVGPYVERSDADAVVSSLRAKIQDITPRVLDLRPTDSAPVSTPNDPLVRWVVQVGSFSNSKSADALVVKLQLAGLTAFAETVISANSTDYKVRIGPEIDRNKAIELARKVKTEHGLDGFVTTQD
jgi:cell division septation protein DedD